MFQHKIPKTSAPPLLPCPSKSTLFRLQHKLEKIIMIFQVSFPVTVLSPNIILQINKMGAKKEQHKNADYIKKH